MYAIEFETDANGRMIEIPQEYEALASKHLKVIILLDEANNTHEINKLKKVSAMTVNTREYKFDREEANAR